LAAEFDDVELSEIAIMKACIFGELTFVQAAANVHFPPILLKNYRSRAQKIMRRCARAPFLSSFSRLLRCRKDLGQFAEVLGGCGE